MEKLQPVIRQIFWVLFGLGLILILWGWYAANSSLSAAISTEKDKVEKTKTAAKQSVQAVPNNNWTSNAQKLNEEHEEAFDESAAKLWEQQLDARVFPPLIRSKMTQLRFRSKINDKALRGVYRRLYDALFMAQLEVIKPFKPEKGTGLVDVSSAQITREDPTKWKTRLPTSPEIWNSQEDIWLLRSIFDAIAEVNAGADRIDKTSIRSLLQLTLRGGDSEFEAGGSASGGDMGGMMGDGGGGMPGGMGMGGLMGNGGDMGGGGMGMGGAAAGGVWSSFKGSLGGDLLTEEFGADPSAGAGMAGMGGMAGLMGGGMGESYDDGGGYDDGESEGGDGSEEDSESTADRYVHYGDDLPYKTRAFTLKVKMLQKDIPKLLASLPNGKFPVEIVRVDVDFSGGSSPGGAGLGGGGMMSGGDYDGGEGGGMAGMMGGGGGMGAAMGLGGPGGPGGPGGRGGLGGGMGAAMGNPGFGGAAGGLGMPGGGAGNAAQTPQERRQAERGQQLFQKAFSIPLATVRVAGLMTIYESPAEKEAEAESQEAAEQEVNDSASSVPDAGGTIDASDVVDDPAVEQPADAAEAAQEGSDVPATGAPAAGATDAAGASGGAAAGSEAPGGENSPVDSGANPAGANPAGGEAAQGGTAGEDGSQAFQSRPIPSNCTSPRGSVPSSLRTLSLLS